jgi:hypothetical protein
MAQVTAPILDSTITTNSSLTPDVSFWSEAEVAGRESSLPRLKMTLAVWKRCAAVMILPVILGGIDEALR